VDKQNLKQLSRSLLDIEKNSRDRGREINIIK